MSQQLDEKRDIIIPILTELRSFNPEIGAYERSIRSNHFNYLVKLDNGRIEIPGELIETYEQAPTHVTGERFRDTAGSFIPDQHLRQRPQKRRGRVNESKATELHNRNKTLFTWIISIVIILALVMYFVLRN